MQPEPLNRSESASPGGSSPIPADLHALGLPGDSRAGDPEALLEAARVPVELRERVEVLEERLQELRIENAPSDSLERARHAALWGAVSNLALDAGRSARMDSSRRRRHALLTGVCAQMLVVRSSRPDALPSRERAFAMGLLHDVGQFELLRQHGVRYARLLVDTRGPARSLAEDEQALFGIDHTQLGAQLAEGWGLSSAEAQAIRCHHGPREALACDPPAGMLFVADAVARAAGLGRAGGARELCSAAEVLLGVGLFAFSEVIAEASELWKRLPG